MPIKPPALCAELLEEPVLFLPEAAPALALPAGDTAPARAEPLPVPASLTLLLLNVAFTASTLTAFPHTPQGRMMQNSLNGTGAPGLFLPIFLLLNKPLTHSTQDRNVTIYHSAEVNQLFFPHSAAQFWSRAFLFPPFTVPGQG